MKFMDSVKPASNEVHVADICTCVLHPASETHRQLTTDEQLAAVRTAYHSAARFCLEVTDENPRTAALYRSLGFESLEYRQMVIDRKN